MHREASPRATCKSASDSRQSTRRLAHPMPSRLASTTCQLWQEFPANALRVGFFGLSSCLSTGNQPSYCSLKTLGWFCMEGLAETRKLLEPRIKKHDAQTGARSILEARFVMWARAFLGKPCPSPSGLNWRPSFWKVTRTSARSCPSCPSKLQEKCKQRLKNCHCQYCRTPRPQYAHRNRSR